MREDENLIKDVEIIREVIKIKDVKKAKILESGIGYIKITEFRETTPSQLDKALAKLKPKYPKIITTMKNKNK